MENLKAIIRKVESKLLSLSSAVNWSVDGKRSRLRLDYHHYLRGSQLLRYVIEVHSVSGIFWAAVKETVRKRY